MNSNLFEKYERELAPVADTVAPTAVIGYDSKSSPNERRDVEYLLGEWLTT